MVDSAHDDDLLRPKRGGWNLRHWAMLAVGLLLLLLGMGVLWIVGKDYRASAKSTAHIQELQQRGLPVDDESLSKYYAQLTSTNNVDQWMKLLQSIDSKAFSQSSMTHYPWSDAEEPSADGSQPWPGEQVAAEFLVKWTDVRRLAHHLAMQDTKVRFPTQFQSVATRVEYAGQLRQLARLFVLESQLAIRMRKSSETLESVQCILGTARSIEGHPLTVCQLVSVAIESEAYRQIKKAVEQDVLSESDLKKLIERLQARTSWQQRWQIAINGERAMGLPIFRDPSSYLDMQSEGGWAARLPWQSGGELKYLDWMQKASELGGAELNELLQGARELEQEVIALRQNAGLIASVEDSLLKQLTPGYAALADAFVQGEVRMRMAILALGLRAYQKKFKRFPAELDQLSQVGLSMDNLRPTGSRPFGYSNVNGQITLWGFRTQTSASTPDQPPTAVDEPAAFEMWVWKMQ